MVCNFDSIEKKTNANILRNFVTNEKNTIIFVIALSKLGKKNFRVVTVSSIILEHMVLFDLSVEQFGTMCSIPPPGTTCCEFPQHESTFYS